MKNYKNIKNSFGLSLSIEHLIALQKNVTQPGGSITTDELYLADAFANILYTFSKKYSFSEIRTDSEKMQEAFSDLMEKRNALGFSLPVNHSALMDVYSKYLLCTGYDSEKIRPADDYKFFEKHASFLLKDSGYHAFPPYIGCNESEILFAPADRKYRFNTSKEKVFPLEKANYHILLVRLDDNTLSFEALAEVLHGNAQLSKDIAYCAPTGKTGLIPALLDTGHGYDINLNTVSALAEKELNPFDLAAPMNCALILAHSDVAQSIAMTILNFGYAVRFVGYSTSKKNVFSIFFQNIYHTLKAEIFKKMLPEYISCVTLSSQAAQNSFFKLYEIKENISLSVFYGITFEEAYENTKNEIEKFSSSYPDKRIYAYLSMPIVTAPQKSNHNFTLPELL